jgi:hypothetical protein
MRLYQTRKDHKGGSLEFAKQIPKELSEAEFPLAGLFLQGYCGAGHCDQHASADGGVLHRDSDHGMSAPLDCFVDETFDANLAASCQCGSDLAEIATGCFYGNLGSDHTEIRVDIPIR